MSAIQGYGRRSGLARLAVALSEFVFAPRVDVSAVPVMRKVVMDAPDRVRALIERQLRALRANAVVVELVYGGESHADWLDASQSYRRIDVAEQGNRDATLAALRAIEAGSVEMVFSVNAIEHMRAPRRIADEIERILKPKGIPLHSVRFSACYNPAPEDYCRFTPDGLKTVFADFECVFAEFEATDESRAHRRRGDADLFAGSREGWLAHFCGRKRA
jgi:hypothetical protein